MTCLCDDTGQCLLRARPCCRKRHGTFRLTVVGKLYVLAIQRKFVERTLSPFNGDYCLSIEIFFQSHMRNSGRRPKSIEIGMS